MSEGVDRQHWRHTSAILAMLVNANPFRSGKPLSPEAFDPYAAGEMNRVRQKVPLKELLPLMMRS